MNQVTDVDIELVELSPQMAATVAGDVPIPELPAFFGRAYHEVMGAVNAAGLAIVGPPFGFYPSMPDGTVKVEAGFAVSGVIEAGGDVHPFELPGGRAIVTTHVGPYETLETTYHRLIAWAGEHGHHLAEGMWEYYLSDPAAEPDPEKWQTRVVWPVAD